MNDENFINPFAASPGNEWTDNLRPGWADPKPYPPRKETEDGSSDEVKHQTQVVQLIKYVVENPEITLFHDEQKEAYVRLPIDGHYEVWSCGSAGFKRWLSKSFYDSTGKVPGQNILSGALQIIEGKAMFDGVEHGLATRVMLRRGRILYDLADKEWRAVQITSAGWKIEKEVPPYFRRYGYQAPQVEPIAGGDIRDVLRFVNIKNPDHQLLFLATLCAYFIPGSPRPILYFHGPQGAAKTTASKILRKLVDPSRVEVLTLPKNVEELKQTLAHYYFLSLDNVGRIYDEVSDILCQAVTGSGFSKRKLYTDDDDIIRTVQANISINGINIATTRPDFLERSVLIELERVDKANRRQEHELMGEFERLRPQLLGSIFSALSRALAIKPTIKADDLPRMADFAVWGAAITEAIDYSREEFIAAYRRNIGTQNEEVLSDNPTAETILALLDGREEWHGMASSLLKELRSLAETNNINPKDLPGGAAALSRELNRIKTSLEEAGLCFSKSAGTKRIITLRKAPINSVNTVVASGDPAKQATLDDGIDDTYVTFGDPSTESPWYPGD